MGPQFMAPSGAMKFCALQPGVKNTEVGRSPADMRRMHASAGVPAEVEAPASQHGYACDEFVFYAARKACQASDGGQEVVIGNPF